MLWQCSLDFILQLSVVHLLQLLACLNNFDAEHYFQALFNLLRWILASQSFAGFSVSACSTSWKMMNFILLWIFLLMICTFYFSSMLVHFSFWQGRLGCTFTAVLICRNQHHWDDWIGCCRQSSYFIWRTGSYSVEVGWGAVAIQFMNWT